MVGINSRYTNYAFGNAEMVGGSHVPWLQDSASQKVWEANRADKDDLYILDAHAHIVGYFSALDRALSLSDGYGRDTLRAWLRDLAGPPPPTPALARAR